MQEEVENRTVNLVISTARLTKQAIASGLRAYLQHRQNKLMRKGYENKDDHIKGKQSVKELIGQNQGASSMVIGDSGVKTFERLAKKYGVDFAVTKDKTEKPHKYLVFFKARDVDALTQIMSEYTKKQMKRPSVLKQLQKYKEKAKQQPKKVKKREKERTR